MATYPRPVDQFLAPRWVTAAAAAFIAVSLVACSAGGTPSTDSSPPGASAEPTEPVPTAGLEWDSVETPGPLVDLTHFSFGAAGRLWIYDPSLPTVLYSTTDADEWVTLDLSEEGLPANASFPSLGPVAIDDRGDSVTIAYTTGTNGSHPAGLLEQIWLVDVDATGETATVTSGASVGLENLPAAEAGLSFRTNWIVDFAVLDGTRFALGKGQWWVPFSTGRTDAFIASETDGQWQVLATESQAPLGANDYDASPLALEVLGDRLVMLSEPQGDAYPFDAWVSSDGREWQNTAATFEGAAPAYRILEVASNGEQLVVLGYEEDASFTTVPIVWSSSDGESWTRTALPGVEEGEASIIIEGGTGYVVLGEAGGDVVAWTSTDGVTWELSDAEIPFAARNAVVVGDSLVAHYGAGTRWSGLDWAATE